MIWMIRVGRTTNISNLFMHRCNLARQHSKDPEYSTAINRKNKFYLESISWLFISSWFNDKSYQIHSLIVSREFSAQQSSALSLYF